MSGSSRFHQRASEMIDEFPEDLSMEEVIRRSRMKSPKKFQPPTFRPPKPRRSSVKSEKRKSVKKEYSYHEGDDDDVVVSKIVTAKDREELARKDAVDLEILKSAKKSPPKKENLSSKKREQYQQLLELHHQVLDIKKQFDSTMSEKDKKIQELEDKLSKTSDENMIHLLKVSKLTRENIELLNSFPITPEPGTIRHRGAKALFYPPTRDTPGTTKRSISFSTAQLKKKRKRKTAKKNKK
jgi:hypothetical protein